MIRANLQLILTCAMNVAGATFENFSPMTSRIDNAQGLWVQGLDIAVPYTLGASTATRKRGFVGRISSMTISRSADSGIVASSCCIFAVLSAVMQLINIGYIVAITRCRHSMQPIPAHCKINIELRNPEDASGGIGQSSHRCCRTAEMSAIVRRASGTCRNDMDFHVPGAACVEQKTLFLTPMRMRLCAKSP